MARADEPRHRVSENATARDSDQQARAILDLRLQRLTALGRDEIKDELDKLAAEIADYLDILRSRARIQAIVKAEMIAVKDEFATPRRTQIIDQEGETEEEDLIQRDVMFGPARGTARRNKLSDFVEVRRSGMLAMRLDEGEAIVDVQICTDKDDVLLTTAIGQCIRFPVDDVRVFTGRTSMGVRGITLDNGDKVISLSILRHVDATSEERAAYLKRANAVRRRLEETVEEAVDAEPEPEEPAGAIDLGEQRYVDLSTAEQFVLTVSERGYGKRTSSYEYRTTGRGGKGIVAMDNRERDGRVRPKIGRLVASFPVEESHQLISRTDAAHLTLSARAP